MSDDFGAKGLSSAQAAPSKDDLITIVQTAINSIHNGVRRDAAGAPILDASVQQPGATVDLCHKQIINLPEEVIEIMKNEIERLAISHNGIASFPPSLAECRRLRYLNGRYNRLKEIPQPVLLLPALEILDLSRNRIRTLPDSIRMMTSLKVLALQKNQIERLPSCLGEMSTLRVLKVNENPLLFPPRDVCSPVDDQTGGAPGDKAMIAVTQRIKKYLREHAGATPKARMTFSESDSDMSESNAETPRPYRPMGTRFPVRPSLGAGDGVAGPSTSPDPPPIPSKSHERMRSNQIAPPRKQTLLSPPESGVSGSSASFGQPGIDVTVRPKRHGMITPRGPDGTTQQAALSPSALQEAFVHVGSRPPSRTGSAMSNVSLTSDGVVETSKTVYNTAGDLYQRLVSLRPAIEAANDQEARTKVDVELQIASMRADALQKAVNKSPSAVPQHLANRHIVKPLMDCLASVSALSRLLVRVTAVFCRINSHESFRQTFWNTQRDIWEIHVANFRMSDILASVTHSRQTSTSSQYLAPAKVRFDSGQMYSRNGLVPSPTALNFSSTTLVNGVSGLPAVISPVPAPLNIQSRAAANTNYAVDTSRPLREDELRLEMSRDAEWDSMCRTLHNMCEITVENLAKVQANHRAERAKVLRQVDQEHDLVKQLSSLIARCNTIMEAANTLARRLENLTSQNRSIRHSLEFWALPRTIFLDWFGLARQFKSLPPSTYSSDIKNTMRPIHHSIKEVSRIVENSPWASYMQKSKHNGYSEAAPLRPNQVQANGPPSASMAMKAPQASNGSVPSTPLSAALGPAAAAAVPSKGSMGRPAINFFERADRYANTTTTQRHPDTLYSKRGA